MIQPFIAPNPRPWDELPPCSTPAIDGRFFGAISWLDGRIHCESGLLGDETLPPALQRKLDRLTGAYSRLVKKIGRYPKIDIGRLSILRRLSPNERKSCLGPIKALPRAWFIEPLPSDPPESKVEGTIPLKYIHSISGSRNRSNPSVIHPESVLWIEERPREDALPIVIADGNQSFKCPICAPHYEIKPDVDPAECIYRSPSLSTVNGFRMFHISQSKKMRAYNFDLRMCLRTQFLFLVQDVEMAPEMLRVDRRCPRCSQPKAYTIDGGWCHLNCPQCGVEIETNMGDEV